MQNKPRTFFKSKTFLGSLGALVLIGILFLASNLSTFEETPVKKFTGTWEVQGRSMFSGVKVKIQQSERKQIQGHFTELNDNKYVNMFVDSGDLWIKDIQRLSNFEFRFIEKKIAAPLFAQYGLETTHEITVQFITHDTLGGAIGKKNPLETSIKYIRRTAE